MEARIYKKKIGDIFLENDLCNTALEVVRKFPPFRFESFFCWDSKKKRFFFFQFFFFLEQPNQHFRLQAGAKQKYLIMLLFNASNYIYYQI